jgi:hypothetical protein
MFLESFGVLAICRSLKENRGFYVELQKSGKRSI